MAKKEKRRKINFLKLFIFILILCFIYLVFSYILGIKTKNIIIKNNSYYTDEEIIEAANIENYPKFILLNKKKIKNKIKSLELINEVKIKKSKGFILTIEVEEKKILYYKRSKDKYVLSDGSLIKLDNVNGVPTLINYLEEKTEKEFINKFRDLDVSTISLISEIEYNKTDYDSKRFLFYMNDGNEVYTTITKLELVDKYTTIVTKLEGKKGILYLDSGNYFEIKEK